MASLIGFEPLPIGGLSWRRDARAIQIASDAPLVVLSSAVVGGGLLRARQIVNMHVPRGYDGRAPADDLAALAVGLGIAEPFVGLMTAVYLDRAQLLVERVGGMIVVGVVTVGLGNTVAAGRSAVADTHPGTINAILIADARLSPAARVNAVISATEAKALALGEAGVLTPEGLPASGTSTDAVVIASTERGELAEYAGPIAPLGAAVARVLRRAVQAQLAADRVQG
jgi:iron complex transport system ATP-binding protein